ncbi:2-keto-4-pentenoate hydratase [Paraburkholderia azotifigens]|uniref:2-keto-4-pentenoate hydratase n=1 Tax=Paraburkholderia azotifigens TaxID=2057004 RepID=A0A5C6VDM6_9BURK|nr:2-keto-4-pentenoate hydratase [Paraburkholderia azotifigens]TXC83347.1 2-keto-4-pentenoate hydratase [Paraburkholderia azotifigens]
MLIRQLADARADHTTLASLSPELIPADMSAAYAIQHALLATRGARIGGWKTGAKSADGAIQGAPLPLTDLHADGAHLPRAHYKPLGLELEIAFRFGRSFEPAANAWHEVEVLDAIESMAATIEIVASRFAQWPNVDKLAQLADLQNHGALIVGEFTPYRRDFPFVAPSLSFAFDGQDVVKATPANPCGDPRRLLTWLVNHCTQHHRIAVTPDMILTTGSYTGMFFPQDAGTAHGQIDGLAPVSVTLE